MDVEEGGKTVAPADEAQPTHTATDGATRNSDEKPAMKASTGVQIKALMKKNMKVHMRTNALPCCPCSLINACCLHVCCPIFFVAIVTVIPFVIVKATLSQREADEFLATRVIPGESAKLWPAWPVDHFTDTYLRSAWYAQPSFQGGPDLATPFGVLPLLDQVFHHKVEKSVQVTRKRGGVEDEERWPQSCYCATLALVGPDSVVDPFRTFLQAQHAEWKASFPNRKTEEVVRDFQLGLPLRFGKKRRLAGGSGIGTSGLDINGSTGILADDLKQLCDVNSGHDGAIFRKFGNADQVDEWVESDNYGQYYKDRSETSPTDRLCGAIVFENDALTASEPAYTIRLNVTTRSLDVSGYLTKVSITPSETNRDAFQWYVTSGFMGFQYMVQYFLAEKRGGSTAGDLLTNEPHVVPLPTNPTMEWMFGEIVVSILGFPIILTMMFGPIVASIAFYVSRERATRQRELLRMMGLSDAASLWSWVLMFCGLNLLISLCMTIFFIALFFKKSNFFLLWMIIWWFANATVSLGMAVAAFISSDRYAAMCSFGVFLVMSFMIVTGAVGDYDSEAKKALLSLLPPLGFLATMGTFFHWERQGMGATFSTAGNDHNNYSVSLGTWMLFVDFWLYLIIYYYADNIVPWHSVGVPRKPWFCFTPSYWREVMGKPPIVDSSDPGQEAVGSGNPEAKHVQTEDDPHLKQLIANGQSVVIRNLNRSFTDAEGSKIMAVDNLSLTMYQDECFCLLGHNGAGKTTTMMMLTGCLPQSSGTMRVKGCSIPEQIREIRSSMGFCPQHNVLIDEITVFEHLELYGQIGGMKFEHINTRSKELISAVALLDKMHTRASALSGGMKRKLSAALAFLAEPYLVILDEPSSGMDPFARRGMWDTLKRWRTGHILCLTTHYMDEADALGDRIAIMSHGKLACCGSAAFLKREFGCGYIITFAKQGRGDVSHQATDQDDKIIKVVRAHVGSEAQVMSAVGKELIVQVPFQAAERFPDLFSSLDNARVDLGVEYYGVSVTNLEEVFLKVAHAQDRKGEQKALDDSNTGTAATASDEARASGQTAFALQLYALLIRRFRFAYRNRLGCCCQVGLPVICVFCLCMIIVLTAVKALPSLVMDTSAWNPEVETGPRVPISVGLAAPLSGESSTINDIWGGNSNFNALALQTVAPASYPVGGPSEGVLLGLAEEASFVRAAYDNRNLHAASQFGGLFLPNTSSWCLSTGQSTGDPCPERPGVTVVANLTALHAAPALFNAHASGELRRLTRSGNPVTGLRLSNHPFQKTKNQVNREEFVAGILIAVIIMAAYGFVPSGATSFVVMEKEKDVKNQLVISGCSYTAYWLSNLIFDMLWGAIPAIGAWVVFAIWDVKTFITYPGINGSVALFVAFLPAMAGFGYLVSFLFSKAGYALFFSWIFNLSIGILANIIISILGLLKGSFSAQEFLRWLFRFVPIFSLGYGHLLISVNHKKALEHDVSPLSGLGVGGEYCPPDAVIENKVRECYTMVGDEFLVLILCGLLYPAITVTLDILLGLPAFQKRFSRRSLPPQYVAAAEDDLVTAEKQRVEQVDEAEQFVYVNHIHKVYGNGTHAVRDISFAASTGQVFGLLGVNGAGKTTTFKMLCGQVAPTAGKVSIQGFDISTQASSARKLIGYCPQFDALLESLTTREHLFLYGRLKGIKRSLIASVVASQLRDLSLLNYTSSRAGQLSGGNKRKLSVAMATIGEPPMVFLDEPSAGMDPVARRGMWSVVQNIADKRQKSVVILTTHSMEEAEALCSRVAIQVDGCFRCLGTPQQIKSKYGQGLELNVRLATPTPHDLAGCCTKLGGTFADVITSTTAGDRVQQAFGDTIAQDLRTRAGSPMQSASAKTQLGVLAEWTLLSERSQAFESFMATELGKEAPGQAVAVPLEKSQNVIRYQISPAVLHGKFASLGELFGLFQGDKERLKIEDFQICQPSLEQIFNQFATMQASQAGTQTAANTTAASPPEASASTAPAPANDQAKPEGNWVTPPSSNPAPADTE